MLVLVVLKNIYMPAVSGLDLVHMNSEKFQHQFQSVVAGFSLSFGLNVPPLFTKEVTMASRNTINHENKAICIEDMVLKS